MPPRRYNLEYIQEKYNLEQGCNPENTIDCRFISEYIFCWEGVGAYSRKYDVVEAYSRKYLGTLDNHWTKTFHCTSRFHHLKLRKDFVVTKFDEQRNIFSIWRGRVVKEFNHLSTL